MVVVEDEKRRDKGTGYCVVISEREGDDEHQGTRCGRLICLQETRES